MIIIYGNGGFAREVMAAAMIKLPHERIKLMADSYFANKGEIKLPKFHPSMGRVVVAIGDPHDRKAMVDKLPARTRFDMLILGNSIGDNYIPAGCIIQPGAILTTNVFLGCHVIVNLNATIGHDCVIGDYTTISPGANISGNVTIGKLCYIGSGAVIREKVSICDNVTIGAGAVVLEDINQPGVYVGVPAKYLKA